MFVFPNFEPNCLNCIVDKDRISQLKYFFCLKLRRRDQTVPLFVAAAILKLILLFCLFS